MHIRHDSFKWLIFEAVQGAVCGLPHHPELRPLTSLSSSHAEQIAFTLVQFQFGLKNSKFGMSLVRFSLKKSTVRLNYVVNLQQMLQHYCYVE